MIFKQLSWLTLIALIVIGRIQVEGFSAQNKQLALSVISVTDMDKNKAEFAVGEPIWVMVSLVNRGNRDITVWFNGDRNKGISLETELGFKDKVQVLTRSVPLEISFRKVLIKAGEQMTFDLLLDDFLQVTGVGDIRFNATMQLKDMNREPLTLKTVFSIKFTRKLNTKEIREMIKRLELQFGSESSADRLRATRSMQAIHTVGAVSFLSKAIVDKDESVQLAAVRALSSLKFHEATIALEKALSSSKDSVKRAAKLELDRRRY